MLFSSFVFMFFFIVVIVSYFQLGKINPKLSIGFLVLCSLFFYGWWELKYLIILLTSIVFNFKFAELIRKRNSKLILTVGILANLLCLFYYKYAGFFLNNINYLFNENFAFDKILLPLAISFFTFQQIAYLVDTFKDPSFKYSFINYSLFVTFFPQLIAGPIVHHSEMMPQFSSQKLIQVNWLNIRKGFIFFALGLFKKIVIADTLALTANPIFNAADQGVILSSLDSWLGAFAYTFQLYFDFSGYADMAIGLGLMFNIMLPLNFNSPYKSLNIIDFWRRWHMTLSRFLRDYLYISLGGSRNGQYKRYRNLLLTMVLGGLWHGAGWNFVLWGSLHGLYLCINHGWNYCSKKVRWLTYFMPSPVSLMLTLISVIVAWVFFRAVSFNGALSLLTSMFSFSSLQSSLFSSADFARSGLWVFVAAVISIFLPNTQQIVNAKYQHLLSHAKVAFMVSIALMWILVINQQTQEFIYFNF